MLQTVLVTCPMILMTAEAAHGLATGCTAGGECGGAAVKRSLKKKHLLATS